MKNNKELKRSNENKVIFGIFGGLGEYFGIDPALLRLLWVAITIFSGVFPGLLTYFVGFLVIPKKQI